MIFVVAQHAFPDQFNFWYVAVAYFAVSNILYMAQQKKLSRKVLFPGSSFYGPNPSEGRGYYFWFRMAVFLLAFLPFNSVLNSAIRNFLCILVASFAVPAVLVNYINPENLLPEDFVYTTPETHSIRILKSKDPKDRFWFGRAVTILLLIAYGINETASGGYLAASLFAVTNAIYFLNFFERILDNLISPEAENAKAEVKNESSSKESSEQADAKSEAAVPKDESPLKEASEVLEAIKADQLAKEKYPSKGDQTSTIKKQQMVCPLQNQLQLQQQLRQMQSSAVITPLSGQSKLQFQPQSQPMHSPALMTSVGYYDVPIFNYAEANEVKYLRQEKAKWEAEKKELTSKLEENQQVLAKMEDEIKKERLTAELKEKRQRIAKIENEKTVLLANTGELKRQRDGLEEEIEQLKSEVRKLKSASEHDQAMVTALEQRGEEWSEEKKRLVEKLNKLKEDREVEKRERARLEEMIETAEGRYEYYLSVTDGFAEKSEEWDAERERLTLELGEAAERCELYKSLLRDGGYETPIFQSF
ncbi:hypothetical protein TIFTF001_007434 [Ficus carica]|uniref:Uncharacterized protein n=1 Tax=Ficus carica TaxID=3494 RepID=A0AA87ZLA2_FICCA|nr:hypothetical protein TIFTF001_007434 [Ficus carica]